MPFGARTPTPTPADRGSHSQRAAAPRKVAHGMLARVSGRGDCYDNSVAESFFATKEVELIMRSDWHTRCEARCANSRYIETWHNETRRHSTLGNVSPAEYEAQQLWAT